jgi:hypothetical protein
MATSWRPQHIALVGALDLALFGGSLICLRPPAIEQQPPQPQQASALEHYAGAIALSSAAAAVLLCYLRPKLMCSCHALTVLELLRLACLGLGGGFALGAIVVLCWQTACARLVTAAGEAGGGEEQQPPLPPMPHADDGGGTGHAVGAAGIEIEPRPPAVPPGTAAGVGLVVSQPAVCAALILLTAAHTSLPLVAATRGRLGSLRRVCLQLRPGGPLQASVLCAAMGFVCGAGGEPQPLPLPATSPAPRQRAKDFSPQRATGVLSNRQAECARSARGWCAWVAGQRAHVRVCLRVCVCVTAAVWWYGLEELPTDVASFEGLCRGCLGGKAFGLLIALLHAVRSARPPLSSSPPPPL